MSSTVVTIVVIILVLSTAVLAVRWLSKEKFRLKKITAKAGPITAEIERETDDHKDGESGPKRTEAVQEATKGGKISGSDIKAPADSGAKLNQRAKGKGSGITDSNIELD